MTKAIAHPRDDPFICPECGSRRSGGHHYHQPSSAYRSGTPMSPWDAVPQSFDCADCFNRIPGHLAKRWQGRTVEEAQKQWAKVFRPLRDEDEVQLIEMLASGWDIVGEGNDSFEVWDEQYRVCASIWDLIEEINCEIDEGIDWSFLASLDGLKKGDESFDWDSTNLEELLSHIDGTAIHKHEWVEGTRSGVYLHLLVKKVDRYRVIKALNVIALELRKQLGTARRTG